MGWDGQHIVLFGGQATEAGTTWLSDLWVWLGTSWQHVRAAGPTARSRAAAGWDGRGFVVSGGYSPLDPRADAAGDLGDTWQYDPSTRRWTRLPGSAGPSSRRGAVASYDAAAGGLVLYGGTNGQVLLNDTWQLTRGRWTRRSGPCRASDCPPAAPSLLLGAAPGLLLCVATKQGQTTWALQGDTWREISTNSPAARLDAVGFYDPERRLSAIVTGTTVDGRHATTTEVYEPVG